MRTANVRLQMSDGQEIYFRTTSHELHRLIVQRHHNHRLPPSEARPYVLTTEKDVPIAIDLHRIEKIHIS